MNPSTETTLLREILSALETGGPWTLVVILGWVVRTLYTKIETLVAAHANEKQALNDRIIAMAERQNDVLERTAQNQTLLLEAVNATTLKRP